MKFRKVSALLLAGAMCAATVVGCGKTSSTSGTSSNDATKAAEDEESQLLLLYGARQRTSQ